MIVAAWRETVVCASPEALEAGVRPGMSQRQAQQLCPDAELLEPDPAGAARLAERIAAALYDLSPVVEVRVEGAAWIDLEGVVLETKALREMRRRLRDATGAEPRLGLAPGPFSARVAAARARPGGCSASMPPVASWLRCRSPSWASNPGRRSGWSCSGCARWPT